MNTFTDPLTLAQEIIDGRRITREDDLSFFLTCDLQKLTEGADRIREARIGGQSRPLFYYQWKKRTLPRRL